MNKDQFVRDAADLINWIDEQIGGPDFAHTPRATTSAALCSLGRQHHRAIVTLIDHDLPGPAAALGRVLFESYIRALWVNDCASDQELNAALSDIWPSLHAMVEAIESTPHLSTGVLAAAKSTNPFNSFTHNGTEALARQLSNGVIEPRFSLEEQKRFIEFANAMGLLIASQMAVLTRSQALSDALMARIKMT